MVLMGSIGVWRKLHLAVDTSTHEVVAAELSLSNVTDAEVLPNLLKQTRRRIIEISGDGAYDTGIATMPTVQASGSTHPSKRRGSLLGEWSP